MLAEIWTYNKQKNVPCLKANVNPTDEKENISFIKYSLNYSDTMKMVLAFKITFI